ncbi:MAG: MlaD family protein [Verrucomicrobiota bacterium]
MQIRKNEITTGILVLVTFGVLITLLIIVGMPGVIKSLNTYRIYYDNANGIRPGAPVLLAGREIGKVTALESPIPLDKRPKDHPEYEVSIDVQVAREAQVYRKVTVRLTQLGLMGQQTIDFVKGDESSGLAENHTEFIGERVPDLSESVSNNIERITGPDSDLAHTIQNVRTFTETLNNSKLPRVIENAEQLTDTLKKEPWRLLWPSTKSYNDEDKPDEKKKKKEHPDSDIPSKKQRISSPKLAHPSSP